MEKMKGAMMVSFSSGVNSHDSHEETSEGLIKTGDESSLKV